jgi:hypothetical protein
MFWSAVACFPRGAGLGARQPHRLERTEKWRTDFIRELAKSLPAEASNSERFSASLQAIKPTSEMRSISSGSKANPSWRARPMNGWSSILPAADSLSSFAHSENPSWVSRYSAPATTLLPTKSARVTSSSSARRRSCRAATIATSASHLKRKD